MDLQQYHNNDNELAFYKFYYLLLKEKLHSNAKYYIYLDKKPVKEKNRVGVLTGFLKAYTSSSRTDCNIRHIQEYSSRENKLIQIADIFTGAVAAKFNQSSTSIPKVKIIDYIEQQRKKPLTVSSSLLENKFNVFIWQPHGNH